MAGDTDELGTKNNPYIWRDIFDWSTQSWTNFINVNPGEDGSWIKVELSSPYNWLIGVSYAAEDGNYVNGTMITLYDSNFFAVSNGTFPPDNYLEVEGVQVCHALDYYCEATGNYYINVVLSELDKKSLRVFCMSI